MAVKIENIEATNTTTQDAQATENTQSFAQAGNSIINMFVKPAGTSEYVRKAREAIEERLKEHVNSFKLFTFDNSSTHKGWAYSFIVIAIENQQTGKVYYMPVLLEATGREPLPVTQIVEIDPRTGLARIKDPSLLFVPSDYFNEVVIEEFERAVKNTYPGKAIRYIDGEIVPYNAEIDAVAPFIAADAINGAIVYTAKDSGNFRDIHVKDVIEGFKNPQILSDVTINAGSSGLNRLQRVVAVDYLIRTKVREQNQQTRLPVMTNPEKELGNISGYVEETIISERDALGNTIKKAVPILVTHEIDTEIPTLGDTLLNVATMTIMNNQSLLLNLLYNKDNIGALNYLVNLEGKGEFGAKVNLKDKKYDAQKAMAYLAKLFLLRPAAAVEIELNGREYFKVSPFAALVDAQVAQAANDFIVSTAETLTGKQFVNRQVFLFAAEIPVGEWVDANGNVRDLREIDLAMIMANTNDITIIQRWMQSNDDPKVTGIDPYLAKLEVYAKLGINAKIHNKAVRVLLNPAFVDELVAGLGANGFNPIINTNAIETVGFMDLSALGSTVFQNALLHQGLGAMPGFTGPAFNPNTYNLFSGFFRG